MPIYEGGQCRQNQFYSSEIYIEPRRSIQSRLLFSSFGGVAGAALGRTAVSTFANLHLRRTSFLKGNLCLHQGLQGLGLFHLGKHHLSVLCHLKGLSGTHRL